MPRECKGRRRLFIGRYLRDIPHYHHRYIRRPPAEYGVGVVADAQDDLVSRGVGEERDFVCVPDHIAEVCKQLYGYTEICLFTHREFSVSALQHVLQFLKEIG